MAEEVLGLLGLVILMSSWLSEAYQAIKEQQSKVPITFAVLYLAASIFLTVHAYSLNDWIFVVLNVFTGLIALMNIYFFFMGKKPDAEKSSEKKNRK